MTIMRDAAYACSWALAIWAIVLLVRIVLIILKNPGRVIDTKEASISMLSLCALSGLLLALSRF
jgi:hypothetical protein